MLNDKFCNVGRTSRIQLVLQTASALPYTFYANTAASVGASFTLSNFSLQCEYVDIGSQALAMLDQTLVDGKMYSHGVTWRTTSSTFDNAAGSQTVLAGIRASSVKSLFARFVPQGTSSITNSIHGKYNSMNPAINSVAFNIGGIRYPQTNLNPLLAPSQTFAELQKAVGSFNNAQFQSSISTDKYCRLAAGATAKSLAVGSTQDYQWQTPAGTNEIVNGLSQFLIGQNVEVCAKRSLLSGLNCTSAPIFLEAATAQAVTNKSLLYVHGMIDCVIIHDVTSGEIQVRC